MKAIIMAGGKGTRIAGIAHDIPKPMILIEGKPVLEHEIEGLREQGFTDILLTVGYLASTITDYFGDGRNFGVHIDYYVEVERMVSFHKAHNGLATLLTHPNDHPYDSGLILADEKNAVTEWLTKEDVRPEWYHNRVNAGVHIISPELLRQEFDTPKVDLDRQLLKPLAGTGRLYCYDSPEYVKDMGTPERYVQVCADYRSGKVQARNLRNRQKTIFLDRDGTINKYVGFLRHPENFELLPNAAEAIRMINESGYLAIVVTNQPIIARGEMTEVELRGIHDKMETLLGRKGAYIDALYYCPHHPHRGYPGEISALKIDCECRKPKPGMLLKAAADYHIDLSESWMIGDGENDVLAGQAAGCRTIQIGRHGIKSLWDAVQHIMGAEE